MAKIVSIDLRKTVQENNFTIRVQVKKVLLVRVGLFFIKIGCYLSGVQYVEEFPMSLLQDGKPVEIDHG